MEAKNTNELSITRVINAPRTLVFKAFTEAEHLAHWWGPVGFKLNVITLDVHPGGTFHYSMTAADGSEMYGIFNYKEISAPEKIVFTSAFADKEGNMIKASFDPNFPLEILNTWVFTEENGKTKLTLKGAPHNANEDENKFYNAMHEGMNQGFSGTFDQLDAYLSKIKN